VTSRADLDDRLFFRVPEVAALTGMDARTVRRAIEAGEIPAQRYSGRVLIPGGWVREQAAADSPLATAPPPLAPNELADLVADRVVARLARALLAPLNENGAGLRPQAGQEGGSSPAA
jgi:excisionase family DNA binding protein